MHNWLGLNKSSAEFQQGSAEIHKGNAELHKGSTELYKSSTELNKSNAEVQKGSTEKHQSKAELHKSSAKFHKGSAELLQCCKYLWCTQNLCVNPVTAEDSDMSDETIWRSNISWHCSFGSIIRLNLHAQDTLTLFVFCVLTAWKVLADFAVFDWEPLFKALCDVNISQIEGSSWKFRHIELSNSVISYIF